MKNHKYAATATILSVLFVSPAVFGQTTALPCLPLLPPGTTMLPPGATLPPGVVACPPTTTTVAPAPVAAPAPAPVAAAPAPAPVAAPAPAAPAATPVSAALNNGWHDRKHEGREKEHDEDDDNYVMAGTVSGNILTVTAITHGKLKIGTKLEGAGLPRGTRIVAFGTGRGGVGTYTITTAADSRKD